MILSSAPKLAGVGWGVTSPLSPRSGVSPTIMGPNWESGTILWMVKGHFGALVKGHFGALVSAVRPGSFLLNISVKKKQILLFTDIRC